MVDAKKNEEKVEAEVQKNQSETKETLNANKEEVEAQAPAAVAQDETQAAAEAADEVIKERQLPQPGIGGIGDLSFLSEVRTDLPEIRPGDVIRVFYRVVEGGKERTQIFEGTVIAMKNKGITKTITVRKTSFGIAVERIFPLNSKLVQKIDVKKHSKVRRAKLYYLRELKGKAARLKELR